MVTDFTMINKLKEIARDIQADAVLITSPENRFYFTGFNSSNGFLLANANEAVFVTDGRYIEAAQNTIRDCEVVLQKRNATQLKDILCSLGAKSVAVELNRVTLGDYIKYSNAFGEDIEIVVDGNLDERINFKRSIKEDWEVQKILKAQSVAEDAFNHICNFIKIGKTEKEIQLELDFYMLSHGADALSFETIALSGKNGSMPHGVPSDNRVQNGDFVTMDFGAVFEGYHSDMTRTVAVGEVSDEQRFAYETVLSAQLNAEKVACAGVKASEVDLAARKTIEDAGLGEYFSHSTGHGVGVEIHEYPNVTSVNDRALVCGNVITDEPGVYLPGKFGLRIEDMLLITENGSKNLTKSPKELIIL